MPQPLVKRLDQIAMAALLLAALATMAVWLAAHYWGGPRLVNIEQAAPLRYQFLVDANQADWPELAQLPGIGEVLARRIVAARQSGRFRTSQDLMRVEGIGPRKLAQIQRYLLPMPEDEMVAEHGKRDARGGS